MNANQALINHFYTCFQKKDFRGMQECYHDEAVFSDEVFQNLSSKEVKAMWQMLIERGKDLELTFNNVSADAKTGKAHWEASYTFSSTGNKVLNKIEAEFEFKDGKIYRHRDKFDFWKWTGMALGTTGKLLGWTSFLKNKVRKTANSGLQKFISRHPEFQ